MIVKTQTYFYLLYFHKHILDHYEKQPRISIYINILIVDIIWADYILVISIIIINHLKIVSDPTQSTIAFNKFYWYTWINSSISCMKSFLAYLLNLFSFSIKLKLLVYRMNLTLLECYLSFETKILYIVAWSI